jgi:eukaryotic-like serine/threonine-protein kinase
MSSPEQEETDLSVVRPEDPTLRMEFPAPAYGNAIGPYRLIQPIGQGGMGEVWLAEQREPVRRRVAIKLIKVGMDTREVVARFESERQALALMDHPAIAKVFDAGSTPDGRPYFAMEYVRGIPITAYCDKHKLTMPQRLELFMRVCEGVQHAHQKAVIHRDLKPSNILVSDVDGSPMPRIIDFGIAKATSQPLTAETMLTRLGAIVGTPGYMSPEQADSAGEDIDTRTDVYSLGVVLYQLLVGAPPLNFHKVPLDQIPRKLREEDAPRPSTKMRSLGDDSKMTAENRRTDPPTLAGQLRGDLDAIALKALEKDRSRRYGSPSDLAADIGRYLKNEPVLAVAPSAAYRARKFARRYRGPLITACAFALVLIAAAGISIWQSVRATKQRDRADAEAATAKAVNDFLQNDLLAKASASNQAGPNTDPDPDLKVRTALDRAAAGIQGKFVKQPLVEASIRQTIGDTYRDLGLYPKAQQQLERALELRRQVPSGPQSDTVAGMVDLADLYDRQNKEEQAEALYQQALAIRRHALGEENPTTLAIIRDLAEMYERRGKHAQAEDLFTKIIAVERRTLGEEHPDLLSTMEGLATLYTNTGRFDKAEQLYAKVQEVRRRTLGEEHPSFLSTESDVAELYRSEGKYVEAEKIYLKVLEVERRVLGGEHPETLNTMNNLAGAYVGEGKFAQAEALHSAVLEIQRRVLGEQHRDTLLSMNNLALVYYRENKYEQAESLWKKALEIQVRVLGEEHRDTLITMNNLGGIYRIQRKYPEAEAMLKRAIELQTRVLGADHRNTLYTVSGLGVLYRSQGKYAEAEPLFKRVLEVRRRVLGEKHPETLNSIDNLATLYTDEGKYKEAESMLNSLVEVRRQVQGEESEDTLHTLDNQATLYREEGKYADAEALFSKIFEARRRALGAEDLATLDAMVSLGQVEFEQQRYSEAESILRQALGNFEKKNVNVWRRYQCQALLGASLAPQQRYEEAEPLQVAGYQGMLEREATIPFEARSTLTQVREQLVKLYESWGKPEKAAEFKHN